MTLEPEALARCQSLAAAKTNPFVVGAPRNQKLMVLVSWRPRSSTVASIPVSLSGDGISAASPTPVPVREAPSLLFDPAS